ncbi:MAG: YifB family Mg chelatase-like AAA ATPase [Butyricicoccus sp.]|nr:YifB family Mg chelatase-like AAA ATPase [Butyricicoccus sp.]
MIAKVHSAGLYGVDGYLLTVECFYSGGLPRLDIVGLPDKAVSEAAERVRAAIKSSGYDWPPSRLVVNLAPADTKKEGSAYDLPILLSILGATGQIDVPPAEAVFLGELSLTGELRPVHGVLSMLLAARAAGCKAAFVPRANALEAAYADGMTVYPADRLCDILDHLRGLRPLTPCEPPVSVPAEDDALDFRHVLGQETVKRALEIAAAGGHNVLMSGSPGSGKSMMARRLPSILPPLTPAERLEVIRVWSAYGQGAEAAHMAGRPFRAPHHTTSAASLAGGSGGAGKLPRPGEVSLAHRGVLFLDELPEFRTDALEVLRQPMDDGEVTISRVAGKVTYPAHFQLIAAMNPCKCGWFGTDRCTCRPQDVKRYLQRISGPLLDRIDLQVAVQPVEYAALAARAQSAEEPSSAIRERVLAACAVQQKRFAGTGILCNAAIPPSHLAKFCPMTDRAQEMLGAAFQRLGLTARAHDRILRVARTIADLENAEKIEAHHLAEALRYRAIDQNQNFLKD